MSGYNMVEDNRGLARALYKLEQMAKDPETNDAAVRAALLKEAPAAIEASAKLRTRANFVPVPGIFHLHNACALVNKAYDRKPPAHPGLPPVGWEIGWGGHCYHVGSSITRRDYRDVDVRFIMGDFQFAHEFPSMDEEAHGGRYNAKWSLTCTTISEWLRRVSDLPIDFQIQSRRHANAKYGAGERSALGMYLTND